MIMIIILLLYDFNFFIFFFGKVFKKCKFNIFFLIEYRMLCFIKEIFKIMIINVNKFILIRSILSYLYRLSVDVINNNFVNVN